MMLGRYRRSTRPNMKLGFSLATSAMVRYASGACRFSALTRNAETQNLMRATQEAAAVVPALAQLSKRFDTERVIELIFNNNSVDLEAVSKDADQIAAEAQQEAAVAQSQLDVASGALAATEGIPGVLTQ